MSLIALMGLMGCGDDALPQEPEPASAAPAAISFSGHMDEGESITRSSDLSEKTTTFYAWGFKNDNGDGYQTVFEEYRFNWVNNSAHTTTTNTNGWEYVGLGTDQTIKYWDWGATGYRFFGVAGGYGTHETYEASGASGTYEAYKITLAVAGGDAPYYSRLWYSTGNETLYPTRKFGEPVRLEFLKPIVRVRFKFSYAEGVDPETVTIEHPQFKPTASEQKIQTKGSFIVSYPLEGTETVESWTVSDTDSEAALAAFTQPWRNDGDWVTVLPAKSTSQGTYTMTATINGEEKSPVVPAEYMDWEPGFQYTYIFKIMEGGGVEFDTVQSGFTAWRVVDEQDHTVYNW